MPYPEPPRTEFAQLALVSEADDPEDFEDVWGIVLDEENFVTIDEYLEIHDADIDDLETGVSTLESDKADDPHDNDAHVEPFILVSERGVPEGIAELSDDGTLRESQVPDLAIGEFLGYVEAENDLTTLEGQRGDYAAVTDAEGDGVGEMHILIDDDHTTLENWLQWKTPEAPVTDVFGRTGGINAEAGDYSYDLIDGDHDNDDHSEAFVSDGDDVERQLWVIDHGASDPSGAEPNDLIFEKEEED